MARRTHRPRLSPLSLSTDTSATLPEYTDLHRPAFPSDLPPRYPDSLSGDATNDDDPFSTDPGSDTDVDNEADRHDHKSTGNTSLSPTSKRSRRPTHRSRSSYPAPDKYLDSLLERSVHALEMSNVLLLHSSLSTQPTLSGAPAPAEPLADRSLEVRSRGMSSNPNRDMHDHWLDDLDDIRRGVEDLFDDDRKPTPKASSSAMISSSLPATSSMPRRHRSLRSSSSLDVSSASISDVPHLRLSHHQDSSHLISPPPRAITQYVASSTDADLILLPSTLGLRAAPSTSHIPVQSSAESRPPLPPPPQPAILHSSTAPPTISHSSFEPSTPAYTMLSSLITRTVSATPTLSTRPSLSSLPRRRSGSASCSSVPTGRNSGRERYRSRPRTTPTSPEEKFSRPSHCPSSYNRAAPLAPTQRCPPIIELSPSPSPPPSSSEDDCPAKLTVQSLRRILDEQPSTTTTTTTVPEDKSGVISRRAPVFLPRSPPPGPTSGTSTATASISRLFTKGTHSSSARGRSPPRQSSLKPHQRSSASVTPENASPRASLQLDVRSSAPSSGRSTPKKITFAELPVGRRGEERRRMKARKGKGKSGEGESWWATWLAGAASAPVGPSFTGTSALMHEERRMSMAMDGYLT